MSEGYAVFLLMNNYFHDVATAMLLACSVVLWVMLKHLDGKEGAMLHYIAALYRGITALFWFSVAWIVTSGYLRFATFRDFEWFNTTQKHFEAGLLVKYAIAVIMVVVGAVLWVRLSREMHKKIHP